MENNLYYLIVFEVIASKFYEFNCYKSITSYLTFYTVLFWISNKYKSIKLRLALILNLIYFLLKIKKTIV